MNSENPIAVLDAGNRAAPPAHDRKTDKRLELRLAAEHCGNAVVLHCQGRLTFSNGACALSKILAEALPMAQRMVVDLAGVKAVDSASLGAMVLTQMWADAAGYTLKFANPSTPVRHLFETTNLVSVFDVHTSVAEAVAAACKEDLHSA
jgi:anti-anti-sigma factor